MTKGNFSVTDPAAVITVKENVMTLQFRYPDNEAAKQMLLDMLTAYDEGESITFELSKPLDAPSSGSKVYGHSDVLS